MKFWKKKANIVLVLLLITGLFGFVLGASGSATKLSYLAMGSGGVVFSDGFEGSNFDSWSAITGAPLISSEVYCSGAFAMDGSQGYVYKALDNGVDDLFLGVSVYFSTVPSDSYSLLGSIWDANFGGEVNAAVNTFGGSSWDMVVNGVEYQAFTPINAGQWYNLVLERSDAGEANLWVDNVNVLSVSGFSVAGSAQIIRIGGGWSESTYYDDVEVSIGGSPSLPTPTPAPIVTASPTPIPTATPIPIIEPTPTMVPSPSPPIIIVPKSNTNTVVAGMGAATSFLSLVGLAVFNKKW